MNLGYGLALFILLIMPTAARGQWQRVMLSGKGVRTDTAIPHALSYFTENPFLRDDGGDFCLSCERSDATKLKAVSTVRTVGTLSGFPIVEILYSFKARHERKPSPFTWKALLVKTGLDLYIEIYHLQARYTNTALTPSSIKHAGDDWVLATFDRDGGNSGGCFDAYWWFDSAGPHMLDFTAVTAAMAARVPAGAVFSTRCLALDLERQRIESWVKRDHAECQACGGLGTVSASFHLDGWRAKPVVVDFQPDQK
jgi:hypothetical protein